MIMAGVIASWRTPFIYASVPNFILAPLFYHILPRHNWHYSLGSNSVLDNILLDGD